MSAWPACCDSFNGRRIDMKHSQTWTCDVALASGLDVWMSMCQGPRQQMHNKLCRTDNLQYGRGALRLQVRVHNEELL